MDVQPLRGEAGVAAYPRAAIDEFVANAAAEQRTLEEAVAEAHNRERRAEVAAAESQATARLLRSTMHELRRELDERHRQVDAQVEGILSRAFDEAGSILAGACRAVRLEPAPVPAVDPAPIEVRDERPSSASLAEARAASAVFPRADVPIDLTGALRSRNRLPAPGDADAYRADGNGAATPEPTARTPHAAGGNGAGASSDPAARTELDLTAATSERRKGTTLGSLLRRGRNRDANPDPAPESDEFLEFLRGALLDDGPLDAPRDDQDPPVRWRPSA